VNLEKLAKEIEGKMKTAGARDHSLYVNTLLKIQQQLEQQSEGRWWKQLRELKEAFESIEALQLGDPDEYRSIFEKKKIPEIFLVS
jgi:hypothetical protein